MARLRSNNVFGTTTDSPLTAGATTLNAAGLANLVAVAGADRAVITLDPNRVHGAPEIVYVTAHTGSATSATILRAQEGTTAREHPAGTFWVHAWTGVDAGLGVLGYAQNASATTNLSSTLGTFTALPPTITFTPNAGRRVKITGQTLLSGVAANNLLELAIFKDGSIGQSGQILMPVTGGSGQVTLFVQWVDAPTAASHTYDLRATMRAGSGVNVAVGAAADIQHILAEDIGPA